MNPDLFGKAINDWYKGSGKQMLTETTWTEAEELPLSYLFRSFQEMPEIERRALELCKGKTLDVGAGAGSHSLYLQEKGIDVTAIDQSAAAIETCMARGVRQTVLVDIFEFTGKFDTILLLMNGTGLAGTLNRLPGLLSHLKSLLAPGGQILIDSSDLIYLFEDESGAYYIPAEGYYGEVDFTMHYDGQTHTLPWLYVSFDLLRQAAAQVGLVARKVRDGAHYDYLARLTP